MDSETNFSNLKHLMLLLFCSLLACTPLTRLSEFNSQETTPAAETEVGIWEAYHKLHRLPGYHLESQSIIRDEAGRFSKLMIVSEQDRRGNSRIQTFTPDGQEINMVVVDGQTYVFEARYKGWVDLADDTAAGVKVQSDLYQASLKQILAPLRLLTQVGINLAEIGHETQQERPATGYQLRDEPPEKDGRASRNPPLALQGTFWIDEATGALLKSELLFYENGARQASQELLFQTSQIGRIEPVTVPAPLVSPGAVIAATATTQAWLTLPVKLNYLEKGVSFELVPLKTAQSSDGQEVEVRLLLRHLPADLVAQAEPFMADLTRKLRLSLPENNLVVPSYDFRLEAVEAQEETIEVTFLFEADLAGAGHVELVLATSGNPLLVTVPVEVEE